MGPREPTEYEINSLFNDVMNLLKEKDILQASQKSVLKTIFANREKALAPLRESLKIILIQDKYENF